MRSCVLAGILASFLEALVHAPYKESDMVELQEFTTALECRVSLYYSGGVARVYVHALFLCQLNEFRHMQNKWGVWSSS